ncbi:hypothetical protein C8R47DRAFT_1083555 [Mycena vitilis]|nr:hypothetical protein C8R47DRAFT_1083555 [Mycena vitilis]
MVTSAYLYMFSYEMVTSAYLYIIDSKVYTIISLLAFFTLFVRKRDIKHSLLAFFTLFVRKRDIKHSVSLGRKLPKVFTSSEDGDTWDGIFRKRDISVVVTSSEDGGGRWHMGWNLPKARSARPWHHVTSIPEMELLKQF